MRVIPGTAWGALGERPCLQERLMVFQGTPARFLEPVSGSSQPPLPLSLTDAAASPGLGRPPHAHAHTQIIKNKINLFKKSQQQQKEGMEMFIGRALGHHTQSPRLGSSVP